MKYLYRYVTNRRDGGETQEFDSLFEAIHFMNNHIDSTIAELISTAEIIDLDSNKVVCLHRKVR